MNTKKHWPSMFKCKSAASTEGQLHETSTVSAMRPQFSGDASSPHYGQERERSPPKSRPRWNPQPAQIQILESIFNSGMLNPPREEIKRIRAKIEEFGQVSEASVFYWFQNRKSRTKRFKQRQRQAAQKSVTLQTGTLTAGTQTGTLSPSSSTPYTATTSYVQSKPITELACSPVNSIHSTIENQPTPSSSVVPASSFAGHHDDPQLMIEEMRIYNELMNMQAVEAAVVAEGDRGIVNEAGTAAVQQSWCAGTGGLPQEPISNAVHPLITVFIDDRPIEIPMGPINFRAYFGDNSVLIHSSGQLVMVNEWGFIPEGLEHGATYFLL